MEKSLIHSNELHFISKKRIHQAVEKMVESLDLAAGSTTVTAITIHSTSTYGDSSPNISTPN